MKICRTSSTFQGFARWIRQILSMGRQVRFTERSCQISSNVISQSIASHLPARYNEGENFLVCIVSFQSNDCYKGIHYRWKMELRFDITMGIPINHPWGISQYFHCSIRLLIIVLTRTFHLINIINITNLNVIHECRNFLFS